MKEEVGTKKQERLSKRWALKFLRTGLWICIMCAVVFGGGLASASDCDSEALSFDTFVRYTRNDGSVVNGRAPIPLIAIPLLLIPDYGSATSHKLQAMDDITGMPVTCSTGKANCDGDEYSWAEVEISSSFSVAITDGGVVYTVTISNTALYWRTRFLGYEEEGNVDFTQNCHGFAFGVGDWPSDNSMGASILLNEGVCYAATLPVDAEIAMLTGNNHSIKVEGSFGLNGSINMPIIIKTTEKFRESQIFKQSNGNGVQVVTGAHSDPDNPLTTGQSLGGLYRKL